MRRQFKTILYIGNDLAKESKYHSAMETLSVLLSKEGYRVIKSSNKKNQLLRLIHMCFSVFKNRKADYVLIDTFSTSAFYYAFFTSQIARFLDKKYIAILHGGNLPYRLKKSHYLSKMIFKNSYKNIAPSNYLKVAFEKVGYNVSFISNPINIEDYPFTERKKLKPNILWVRAFKYIYNTEMAIEVLRLLKLKYPEAKLCMVGPRKDDSLEKTIALAKKYSLDDSVFFTGVLPREEWYKLSKEYDVFINTTSVDNTPVSVIEAMALGLPIVSTNVGGIPYLIENNANGILVEENNAQQMAKSICDLIESNNQEIITNARKKVELFSWNNVKYKWLEILQ